MRSILISLFPALLTWWGLWLIAALDSTVVFFLPLAVDIAVIILASRSPEMFWLYPIIASLGSASGAAVTYYIGRRIGEAGLERLVSEKRLAKIQRRIEKKGAVAVAALDLLPPPFPFTAFILAAGAFRISVQRFFPALVFFRILRFGVEAILAFFYGQRIIAWFRSDAFEYIATFLCGIAILGTTLAIIKVVRSTRAMPGTRHRRSVA